MQRSFRYESLDVYRDSLRFVGAVWEVLDGLGRPHRGLKERLADLSTSLPLGIAKGSTRQAGTARRDELEQVHDAALKCGAMLDVLVAAGARSEEDTEQAKTLLLRMVATLRRMLPPRENQLTEEEGRYGTDYEEEEVAPPEGEGA